MSAALPKFSMIFTADASDLKAKTAEVRQELTSTGTAAALAAKGVTQQTMALDRMGVSAAEAAAKERVLRTSTAANVNSPRMGDMVASSAALANHEVTNLSYQLSDMAVQLAGGQSPFMIMMQQGTQVAGIMGDRGLGALFPALASGIASMVNPTTLVLAGMTAAGYAGYAAFRSMVPEIKSVEELLEKHGTLVGRLKDKYGEAADGMRRYATESTAVLAAEVASAKRDYQTAINQSAGDVLHDLLGRPADEFGRSTPLFGQMASSIESLRASLQGGSANLRAFRDEWAKIEVSPYATASQRELAAHIRETTAAGAEADQKLRSLPATLEGIGRASRQSTEELTAYSRALERLGALELPQLMPREEALKTYQRARENASDLETARKALEEYEKALTRIDNAEAGARAPIPTPRPLDLAQDPKKEPGHEIVSEQQARLAFLQAQVALGDQTEQQQARANALFQAENEIRREGIDLQSARAGEIRKNALALFDLEAALKRQTRNPGSDMVISQRERLEFARAQLAAVGMTADQQGRLNALFQAENAIRREGLNAGSARANEIRQNAEALYELEAALKRQTQAWEQVRDVGRRSIDSLVDGASSGMEGLKKAGDDIAKDIVKQLTTLATNPLKNALYGDNLPTIDNLGGIGGFVGALLGGKQNPAMSATRAALQSSTGSMMVTAGTVMINGGVSGGPLGSILGAGTAGAQGVTGAGTPAGAAVTKALGLVGANETGNRDQINGFLKAGGVDIDAARTAWCAGFVNSALEQVGIKGSGSLTANSFQGWGQAVDLSKVMAGDVLLQSRGLGAGQTGGHVGLATGQSRMGAAGLQLEMLSGNSSDAVSRTWIDAVDLQARRATEAASALGSVGNASGTAVQGLGTFGNGLGQLGQALSSAPAATAQGGGSWLSNAFGSIFGGGRSSGYAGANYFPPAPVSPLPVGLFDVGGWTGDMAADQIAGFVHGKEFVVKADVVAQPGVRAFLQALNDNKPGYASGGYVSSGPMASAPVYQTYQNAFAGRAQSSDARPSIQIVNNTPAQVRHEERTDEQGGRQQVFVVSEIVDQALTTPGTRANRTMRQSYGLKPQGVRR